MLLPQVALVEGSVADEVVVGVDVVSVSSSGSQSRFSVRFISGSISSNSSDTPSFLVLELQTNMPQDTTTTQ